MRKICIVGSSHISAFKLALTLDEVQMSLNDKAEVTLFGSPQDTLSRCTVANGKVTPATASIADYFRMTSGGESDIILDEYDDIYIVAGYSPWNAERFLPPGGCPPPSPPLYDAIASRWRESWPYRFASALRSSAKSAAVHFLGAPIISVAAPNACAILPQHSSDTTDFEWRNIDVARSQIDRSVLALDYNLDSLVRPPTQCLDSSGLFTRHEYCTGSVKLTSDLSQAHDTTDFVHMNGLYGKEALRGLGIL